PFLSNTIYLDDQPLIPRTETEFWVEKAIEVIKGDVSQPNLLGAAAEPPRLLDLCAGSGAIGVSVATHIPNALVDFVEIDRTLLPTIVKNISENNIEPDRYHVYHSNLFMSVPTTTKYDFILSNPPYIDPALDRTTDSVRVHEPHLALYGGVLGLEVIEQIIENAPNHLKTGGQLWIEHEPEQAAALATLATQHNFSCTTYKDQYDVLRYSVLVLQ
ncbi:HemK family protein methyltransferase, partial [Candidatus Kaiserbacteria bacterium]|nr:HemK family protein methyltransferase [Candidatus Kaiserbacteria bacterium]